MNKQEVLKALVSLKEHVPDTYVGICCNVWLVCGQDAEDWISAVAQRWVGFSGNGKYPVPHPDFTCPVAAYQLVMDNWEGEYGQLRYELLDFLIEELTKEVELEEKRHA